MAEVYKVLGQARPSSTSNANLYTVPANTSTVISTIAVTNTSIEQATARIYIRVYNGSLAAASQSNALVYDTALDPSELLTITAGITLGSQDVITVQSGTADALTFQVFGSEIS